VEYLSPWAEALHFAWSCGLVAASGPLGRGVVDGLRRVLRGGDSSAAEGVFRALFILSQTTTVILTLLRSSYPHLSLGAATSSSSSLPPDGLVRQGRALTLARAAVTAEVASAAALRLAGGVAGADAPLGPVVAALLCDPSRYRTSTSPCQP